MHVTGLAGTPRRVYTDQRTGSGWGGSNLVSTANRSPSARPGLPIVLRGPGHCTCARPAKVRRQRVGREPRLEWLPADDYATAEHPAACCQLRSAVGESGTGGRGRQRPPPLPGTASGKRETTPPAVSAAAVRDDPHRRQLAAAGGGALTAAFLPAFTVKMMVPAIASAARSHWRRSSGGCGDGSRAGRRRRDRRRHRAFFSMADACRTRGGRWSSCCWSTRPCSPRCSSAISTRWSGSPAWPLAGMRRCRSGCGRPSRRRQRGRRSGAIAVADGPRVPGPARRRFALLMLVALALTGLRALRRAVRPARSYPIHKKACFTVPWSRGACVPGGSSMWSCCS